MEESLKSICSSDAKLNNNPNLIAFENGIYDLTHHVLRDGIPDDMISYSTNYKYPSKQDLEAIQRVQEFLQTANTHLLAASSSFLNNAKQIFILTGDRHAKKKYLSLCASAFGEYYGQVDCELVAQGYDGKRFILVEPTKQYKLTQANLMFVGKKYGKVMVDLSSKKDLLGIKQGTIDAYIAHVVSSKTKLKPTDAVQFMMMMLKQLETPITDQLQHIDDYIETTSPFKQWLNSKYTFTDNILDRVTVEGLYRRYNRENKAIIKKRFIKMMSLFNKEIRHREGVKWYEGLDRISD